LTPWRNPGIRYHVIFGTLEIDSPYLWGKDCRAKPLVDEMGVSHQGRSMAVERALSDFGIEESFGQAAKRFKEHYGYEIDSSTIRRVTHENARQAQVFVEERLRDAGDHYGDARCAAPAEHLLIELDGCEIRTAELHPIEGSTETTPVRENPKKKKAIRWREVRIGLARPLDSVSKLYVGQMEQYPAVVEDLFCASVLQGMTETTRVVAVADGGNGLREELEAQFHNIQFILDKTHLKDHLYETAEELGISREQRPGWVQPRLEAISNGKVAEVKAELEEQLRISPNERLRRLIGYLKRFIDAVNYGDFKAQGFPIGSGEVESAHKSIPQKRLKIPGASWHPDSINPVVALRVLRANNWWKDYWEKRSDERLAA